MASFMWWSLLNSQQLKVIETKERRTIRPGLSTEAHTARIRIIRGAGGNRENADAGSGDFALGGGRRDLGGGSGSGESEGDDESTNGKLHVVILSKFSGS
jgi:hypothetical protein